MPQQPYKYDAFKYKKWRSRAFFIWTLVGVCILIGVVLHLCGIMWQAVATIIITTLATFLLHGLVDRLERRGVPRAAGAAIVFVIVTLIVAGCAVALIPAVVSQTSSLILNLPDYINQVQSFIVDKVVPLGVLPEEQITKLLSNLSAWIREESGTVVSSLANGVIGITVGVGNVVVIGLLSLLCSFWILLDLPKISRELRVLIPEKWEEDADIIGNAFGKAVYGWARSTLLCAIITGLASGIAFFICGIPYSGALGFLCGILYFVPYIGTAISCVIVAALALFVSPFAFIASIVILVVIHNIVGNVISPKLMESSVNVHPAIIIIALMAGGALGGAAGLLLAIPIVGAVQGVCVTYFEARTGKTLATENGALFQKKREAKLPNFATGAFKIPDAEDASQTPNARSADAAPDDGASQDPEE